MTEATEKNWIQKYIRVPLTSSHNISSFTVRSDGEVIQKWKSNRVYDSIENVSLTDWNSTLEYYSEGLIEPKLSIENGADEENPFAEPIVSVSGWVEDLTPLELKLAKEMVC